jgi:hypothetical protein
MINECQGGAGIDHVFSIITIGRTESLGPMWSATVSINLEQNLRNQFLRYERSRNQVREWFPGEICCGRISAISMITVHVPCRVPAGLQIVMIERYKVMTRLLFIKASVRPFDTSASWGWEEAGDLNCISTSTSTPKQTACSQLEKKLHGVFH